MGIRQALGIGTVNTLTIVKAMVDRAITLVDPLAVEVPGFNPRDNYEDYETLYYTDPDVNTAINVISTLATGESISGPLPSHPHHITLQTLNFPPFQCL